MITFLQAFAGFAAAEFVVAAVLVWLATRRRMSRLETTLRLTLAELHRRKGEYEDALRTFGINLTDEKQVEVEDLQAQFELPSVSPERGDG